MRMYMREFNSMDISLTYLTVPPDIDGWNRIVSFFSMDFSPQLESLKSCLSKLSFRLLKIVDHQHPFSDIMALNLFSFLATVYMLLSLTKVNFPLSEPALPPSPSSLPSNNDKKIPPPPNLTPSPHLLSDPYNRPLSNPSQSTSPTPQLTIPHPLHHRHHQRAPSTNSTIRPPFTAIRITLPWPPPSSASAGSQGG